MVKGIWGKKIGMTQVFSGDDKVVPVTAIDIANWIVTQVKTEVSDGYCAIQIGRIKDRYVGQKFSSEWLKKTARYFSVLREVPVAEASVGNIVIGKPIAINTVVSVGDYVDVAANTKGCGFAGVMRRHNFTGGKASHGCTVGRAPGGIGFFRAEGRVIKGKKLPGHMGNKRRMIRNLDVVAIEAESNIILVKGAIPGKAGSLVYMRKA